MDKQKLDADTIINKYFTDPAQFKFDCGKLAGEFTVFNLKYGAIGMEILKTILFKKESEGGE